MKKLILISFGVLMLTSCLKDEVPFQYTIRVFVTDADIIVLSFPQTGRSDFEYTYNEAEGYYEFSNLMNAGTYRIVVQKSGYRPWQRDVTLGENRVASINVTLTRN